jgi:hypothetical protein
MKLKYTTGLMSLFNSFFPAVLLSQAHEKQSAKNDNLSVLSLASLLPKPQAADTAYVLVPNSDTTMPHLSVISHSGGINTLKNNIILESNPGDTTATANDHIFVNVSNANKVAVLNVDSTGVKLVKYIDSGKNPVHIYQDPSGKIWSMNDGTSGVDTLNSTCNAGGVGSVTIIQDGAKGASDPASLIKNLCIGKGHHKAIFTSSPKRTFISNISDNSISVVDNEPTSGTYLTVISTINLGAGAGPHGFSYSSMSGKVYISAQTAGTIIAVSPSSLTTETISTTKSGPSVATPNGQYIAIPGKDTTTDTNHLIGKITILNSTNHTFSTTSIMDVSPDHMMFSSDGKRLYVISAQAGTGNQLTNLKQNVLLVYDSSNLPNLTLVTEIKTGDAKTGHRHIASASHGSMMHLFIPSGNGFLYSVDSMSNSVTQQLELKGSFSNVFYHTLGSAPSHSH